PCRGVMNLKKELQEMPIARLCRIENNFDSFRMTAMVTIGRVRHVATGIADTRRHHPRKLAKQILHPPETSSCEYGALMHVSPLQPDRDNRHSPAPPFGR